MKKSNQNYCYTVVLLITCICNNSVHAQQSTGNCKVDLPELAGSYTGDCKNGYAHGKGEAIGLHRYVGAFKQGLPNGQGTYYYNDSIYHTGNFQDGN